MALRGNKYKVELKDMHEMACRIDYDIDDDFFEMIDAPEIHKGRLHVAIDVEKAAGIYKLTFRTKGEVIVACDRCLDDLTMNVSTEDTLRVKLGSGYSDEEDIITVPEEEGCIDVAWLIYEFVELSLPMKRVHEPGGCNPAMMEVLAGHLCEDAGTVSGGDGEVDGETTADPRWDALKEINNNNNK